MKRISAMIMMLLVLGMLFSINTGQVAADKALDPPTNVRATCQRLNRPGAPYYARLTWTDSSNESAYKVFTHGAAGWIPMWPNSYSLIWQQVLAENSASYSYGFTNGVTGLRFQVCSMGPNNSTACAWSNALILARDCSKEVTPIFPPER